MKQNYIFKLLFVLCAAFGLSTTWGQITVIDYSGDMVSYTVPAGVTTVSIEALGAQGASGQTGFVGGKGASMYGEFAVSPGDVLIIAVGGEGQGQDSGSNGGGGGGSFVVRDDGTGGGGTYTITVGPFAGHDVTPLVVAGGGGGTRATVSQNGNPGVAGNMGTSSSGSSPTGGGTPVTASEMGGIALSASWGSGGGGFVGDGGNDGTRGFGGDSFLSGAAGGTGGTGSGDNAAGGFGSGGQGRGSWGGGGGGGWSGGQGGRVGGGGGSFNSGIAQVNVSDVNEGNGQVTIEVLCLGLDIDIPVTGVCIGDELYISATSLTGGIITWDGGVMDGVLFAPVLGTTTYTASSTSTEDCAFSVDISASEIPVITAVSSDPAACEGAYLTVWGEGGDTYTWTGDGDVDPVDSVAFPAEEGTVTYTVIGSILGCEGPAASVTLVGAAQPDVSGVADPANVCLGESYTLTASGADTYSWGGGIVDGGSVTQESAGTFIHFLIGTSAEGCHDTTEVTVVVNPTPIVDAGDNITVCQGDEVTLNASGALTYVWSPAATDGVAFTADVAGEIIYTVTGTDVNECTDTDDLLLTVVELPVITAVVTDEYYGYDGEIDITVTGGSGEYTYIWSHGPITEDVTGLTSGITYTVEVNDITIDQGLCPVEASYTLTSFIGLNGESISLLSAYPNPTNGQITLVYSGAFNYEISTVLGQVITTGSAVDSENLSLKEMANGTYIVKVTAGNNTSYLQIVKQ